ALLALSIAHDAGAAERPVTMPLKAPIKAPADDDWSGFYLGAHFGYAWGRSDWSSAPIGGGPSRDGSFDLFRGFDFFKGTGSYFSGLQGGYNVMLPSRFLFGIEADISFPNSIDGIQLLSAPAIGLATYEELVQFSGTVRGRVGYAPGHWLIYAMGGFAWSYSQFTRT